MPGQTSRKGKAAPSPKPTKPKAEKKIKYIKEDKNG